MSKPPLARSVQSLLMGGCTSFRDFKARLRDERADLCSLSVDTLGKRWLGTMDDLHKPERLSVKSKHWFTSERSLRQYQRADFQHVDPRIKLFAGKLVMDLRAKNLPFFIHSAFRTRSEQDALVRAGRSKASWPRAPHCQGAAVDIVHSHFAWDLTKAEWLYVGAIGKQVARRLGISVQWGGDWSFYDPAHWELADWRSDIRRLEAGEPVRICPAALAKSF